MRALTVLALSLAAMSTRAEDQFITWESNYRTALQQAKTTGKPLLVEFRCEA